MPVPAVGHPDSARYIKLAGDFFKVHFLGQDVHNHGFGVRGGNDSHTNVFPFHKICDLASFDLLGKLTTLHANQGSLALLDGSHKMPSDFAFMALAEGDVDFFTRLKNHNN
jgi:hypothetical protein